MKPPYISRYIKLKGIAKQWSTRTKGVTHLWLQPIGSSSIAAHLGGLDGLAQGDGVGFVLLVHLLTVQGLWLTRLGRGCGVGGWGQ